MPLQYILYYICLVCIHSDYMYLQGTPTSALIENLSKPTIIQMTTLSRHKIKTILNEEKNLELSRERNREQQQQKSMMPLFIDYNGIK